MIKLISKKNKIAAEIICDIKNLKNSELKKIKFALDKFGMIYFRNQNLSSSNYLKFAINTLKIIFGYPWKTYYSFWLFWLLGFPIFLNILWIILDGVRYLILSNFEVPRFIAVIVSVILFVIFIQVIARTIIYLGKK